MKIFIYSWLLSFLLLISIDYVWFSITLQRFYKPYIGHLFTGNFSYTVAFAFYILYSFGITYLILNPNFHSLESLFKIFCNGFILGLVAYGAYDLTNHATMKDWPMIVTVVDMLWGGTLTSITAVITYKIMSFFI